MSSNRRQAEVWLRKVQVLPVKATHTLRSARWRLVSSQCSLVTRLAVSSSDISPAMAELQPSCSLRVWPSCRSSSQPLPRAAQYEREGTGCQEGVPADSPECQRLRQCRWALGQGGSVAGWKRASGAAVAMGFGSLVGGREVLSAAVGWLLRGPRHKTVTFRKASRQTGVSRTRATRETRPLRAVSEPTRGIEPRTC